MHHLITDIPVDIEINWHIRYQIAAKICISTGDRWTHRHTDRLIDTDERTDRQTDNRRARQKWVFYLRKKRKNTANYKSMGNSYMYVTIYLLHLSMFIIII